MDEKKYDVAVLANAIVDILVKIEDSFLSKHALQKASMSLVTQEEATNLYNKLPSGTEMSGGSACNTAAGIASFGGKATLMSCIKNDQFGKVFIHDMKSVGVEFTSTPHAEGAPTAQSFVLITPDSERTMCTYLGALEALGSRDLNHEKIAQSTIFFTESYLFYQEKATKAVTKAIKIAKENKTLVALTLSDSICVEINRQTLLTLINQDVDILFANEQELIALFETPHLEEALQQIMGMCNLVSITRSEHGSITLSDNQTIITPCSKLKGPVLDATGAGDMYAAGFLYAYTHGYDVEECARIANDAAGYIIQQVGARPKEALSALLSFTAKRQAP